ncbi:MAG TPA: hypothetical protein DEA08_21710 [Planctomycetes bacterium]|nr:hypothetical protein [Planctomycetota bacterium]
MNVHPGETLADLLRNLAGPVRRVRDLWRGQEPLGLGLWLPSKAARAIAEDPGVADEVRAALASQGLFAYTVNAFPIGDFHAESVKREVYRPSWAEVERLDYTRAAAQALAALLPEGERGSLSTVPVSYKSFAEASEPAGAALGELAWELERLEAERGVSLALALEPEPLATLETCAEAAAFLSEHVFAGSGAAALAAAGGPRGERGEAVLRERIGVCVDTCHLACAFEDLEQGLATLAAAGVRVVKAQLSSALELRDPAANEAGWRRLLEFAEPRYLHQTRGRGRAGELIAWEDLDQLDERARACELLRTHFHVPLSWTGDEVLGTTRPELERGLAALAAATDHLEVETYTFSVLPPADRARYHGDVVEMVVAELRWAEAALRERGFTCG